MASGEAEADLRWMSRALELARAAAFVQEVPVGAVIVREGRIIGEGHNRTVTDGDPTTHAEMVAIRQAAAAMGDWRLLDSTLYVTLEPCAMCAGALVSARIARLVYGCYDPKAGAIHSLFRIGTDERLNHRFAVTQGVLADEGIELLRAFFARLRAAGEK
jgi:tRNA(adenine34) deaminase